MKNVTYQKIDSDGNIERFAIRFPVDTEFSEIEDVEIDGVRFSPATGNRVDEKTAAARKAYPSLWGPHQCKPGYVVTFERSDSQLFAALGR